MATTHSNLLQLAAILVLLVWNDCNGNHSPAVVLAAPALVVLGDSTVDVGVNSFINTIIRADWPPYGRDFPGGPTGRFCDGKLICDFIAERMGLPYQLAFNDPSAQGNVLLQGTNTASSGSGYWDNTVSALSVSLSQQVQWVREWQGNVTELVGEASAAAITQEGIFAFSTGANDWINNYYTDPSLMQKYNVMQYSDFILGILQNRIQDLYNLGARKFGAVSLPPLGCVPAEMLLRNSGGKCIDEFNNAAITFNSALQNFLSTLQGTLPGSTMVYLDSHTQLYNAFLNPSQYGIVNTNTDEVCCHVVGNIAGFGPLCNDGSPVCANADEYLWWDAFHPTQFFNKQCADALYTTLSSTFGV